MSVRVRFTWTRMTVWEVKTRGRHYIVSVRVRFTWTRVTVWEVKTRGRHIYCVCQGEVHMD